MRNAMMQSILAFEKDENSIKSILAGLGFGKPILARKSPQKVISFIQGPYKMIQIYFQASQ
jgi:hypothetical protein